MKGRAAIVLMRETAFQLVEWGVLLEFCADRHLTVTAMTREPAVAVGLAAAGFVDAVVAPTADRQRILINATCRVELVRPMNLRESAEAAQILSMLARGGTPQIVAQLLDLPLNLVLDVRRARHVLNARQRTPAERQRAAAVFTK